MLNIVFVENETQAKNFHSILSSSVQLSAIHPFESITDISYCVDEWKKANEAKDTDREQYFIMYSYVMWITEEHLSPLRKLLGDSVTVSRIIFNSRYNSTTPEIKLRIMKNIDPIASREVKNFLTEIPLQIRKRISDEVYGFMRETLSHTHFDNLESMIDIHIVHSIRRRLKGNQ